VFSLMITGKSVELATTKSGGRKIVPISRR
jgi:hypothetical protein